MAGDNVRKLVDRSLGTTVVDMGPSHSMTVKLSQLTYAKLRALVLLVGRPKTPLASDILEAAIDDFIAGLPEEFSIDVELEEKMLGVAVQDVEDGGPGPYTLQNLVGWTVSRLIQEDAEEEEKQEKLMVKNIEAQISGKNGARK